MSLRVWLPLNGNLNNQGVSNITVTNNNATVNASGKIGSCYSFNGSSTSLMCSAGLTTSDKNWSFCCWAKLNNNSGTMCLYSQRTSTTDTQRTIFLLASKGIYIDDGVRLSGTLSTTATLTDWCHYAVVRNGNTATAYINGIQAYSASITVFPSTMSTACFFGASQSGSSTVNANYLNGYVNDIRLYDHALSIKEIKEISKGLVCHYPLDANGLGVPNLVDSSNTFNGWSAQTGWTKGTSDDGTTMYSFSRTGATSNTWNRLIPTLQINGNNYPNGVTMSMELLTPDKSAIDHKCLGSLQIYQSDDTRIGWVEPQWDLTNVVNNQWSIITWSFSKADLIKNNTSGTTYAYTKFSFQLVKNGNISIRKIMIAEGNKAQPYTLSLNDTGTTEIDIAGYKYDGTRVSVINDSADSPRYLCCTRFPSTTHIKYKCTASNMYYATYSMWVKFNTISNYGGFHMQYNNPSGGAVPWFAANTENTSLWCYFGGNSPNYTKAGSGDLQTNTWYHIVYVWDNGVAQWYLNGAKYGNSVTYTGKKYIQNNVDTSIGDSYTGTSWGGTPFDGWVSDFRLYATALSADDIKELYQTSASIDNGGNILGYEFNE